MVERFSTEGLARAPQAPGNFQGVLGLGQQALHLTFRRAVQPGPRASDKTPLLSLLAPLTHFSPGKG